MRCQTNSSAACREVDGRVLAVVEEALTPARIADFDTGRRSTRVAVRECSGVAVAAAELTRTPNMLRSRWTRHSLARAGRNSKDGKRCRCLMFTRSSSAPDS